VPGILATMNIQHPVAQLYKGFALAEREQNLRDDSYFHLSVWNPDTAAVEEFQYAATAYPSNPMHPETVHALLAETLPSVKAASAKYWLDQARAAGARVLDYTMFTVEYYWKPFKGDVVRVARGRKVRKGLVGEVISSSERTFGYNNTRTYVLIDCGADGTWTVDTANVDCVRRSPAKLQELFDLSN
jgi:hypothetical protein